MTHITRYIGLVLFLWLTACSADVAEELKVAGQRRALTGPGVVSLTLNPTALSGGSGASSTGTVTLSGPAPAGGTVVSLSSSNTGLAASVPWVRVPEGATSATFTVGTNPRYRRYSGLAFSATISASANGASAAATLSVTAQPRPGPFAGDSNQREGEMCGGHFAASAGDHGVLFDCVRPPNFGTTGTCTFLQECLLGCLTSPQEGFQRNDTCATSGPFPIALNPSYLIGGERSAGTLLLSAPAPMYSSALVRSQSSYATAFPTGYFSIPTGATSVGFDVATSIVPSVQFVPITVNFEIPTPIEGGGTHVRDRTALAWLAVVPPPENPPAEPQPVLGYFAVDIDPVNGGSNSSATVFLSGMSQNGGPTISFSSSNPQVASLPASLTVPPGSNVLVPTITTKPVSQDTTVTLTATDGRHTLVDTITVKVSTCTPTTCAAQGKNCGTISDGCGGTLNCGTCVAPETCGGGGIPNVCGACTPTTCAAQGKNCGSIYDGCGGTLNCGTCPSGQVCSNNVCLSTATLTVTATGRSGERVLSSPTGINVSVGSTQSASFTVGTTITLSATNNRDVVWSGACSSGGQKTKSCTFTLNANASLTANVQ